jgi:PilZ domain
MVSPEALLPVEVYLEPRGTSANRRYRARFHCGPATLGRLVMGRKGEATHSGWILDLSTQGAGLLLPVSLPIQSEFLLQINSNDGTRRFEVRSRVIHVTPQSEGEWLVGGAFYEPLTEDDLDALL